MYSLLRSGISSCVPLVALKLLVRVLHVPSELIRSGLDEATMWNLSLAATSSNTSQDDR
jgi:hypothetical protein